jgi:hypothetical protein
VHRPRQRAHVRRDASDIRAGGERSKDERRRRCAAAERLKPLLEDGHNGQTVRVLGMRVRADRGACAERRHSCELHYALYVLGTHALREPKGTSAIQRGSELSARRLHKKQRAHDELAVHLTPEDDIGVLLENTRNDHWLRDTFVLAHVIYSDLCQVDALVSLSVLIRPRRAPRGHARVDAEQVRGLRVRPRHARAGEDNRVVTARRSAEVRNDVAQVLDEPAGACCCALADLAVHVRVPRVYGRL